MLEAMKLSYRRLEDSIVWIYKFTVIFKDYDKSLVFVVRIFFVEPDGG